jgi:hypothetical protein
MLHTYWSLVDSICFAHFPCRIGQKRNVDTVRLVARGTIEELMYARQVYKVQLKKQTLGHNPDGNNQPQIFRGVVNDPNRKGELFGLENLLKFKDGSFMSSLVRLRNLLSLHAYHSTCDYRHTYIILLKVEGGGQSQSRT